MDSKTYKKWAEYWDSYTDLEFLLGKNWENNTNLEWVEDAI